MNDLFAKAFTQGFNDSPVLQQLFAEELGLSSDDDDDTDPMQVEYPMQNLQL